MNIHILILLLKRLFLKVWPLNNWMYFFCRYPLRRYLFIPNDIVSWCWNLWDVFSVSIEIQHDCFNFRFFVLHVFSYYELILQSWDLKVLLNSVHQNFVQYFHIFFRRKAILMLSFSGFGVKVILTSCSEMRLFSFVPSLTGFVPELSVPQIFGRTSRSNSLVLVGLLNLLTIMVSLKVMEFVLFPAYTCINTY